jgi:hypothetical protein
MWTAVFVGAFDKNMVLTLCAFGHLAFYENAAKFKHQYYIKIEEKQSLA